MAASFLFTFAKNVVYLLHAANIFIKFYKNLRISEKSSNFVAEIKMEYYAVVSTYRRIYASDGPRIAFA
jgi:hypothetical protein